MYGDEEPTGDSWGQCEWCVEELFAFLKCAFEAVRTTHRAAHALPIHLLCCLLAYSLYKSLIAQLLLPGIASAVSHRAGLRTRQRRILSHISWPREVAYGVLHIEAK